MEVVMRMRLISAGAQCADICRRGAANENHSHLAAPRAGIKKPRTREDARLLGRRLYQAPSPGIADFFHRFPKIPNVISVIEISEGNVIQEGI